MYRILDGRGTGKTSRLMLLAKENKATFVCQNPKAMEAKAHAYGIVGIEFMSYYDFIHSNGTEVGSYVVDEAENLFTCMQQAHCGNGKLIGYTLSLED